MTPLGRRVARAIEVDDSAGVAVAVSGGADSVALAWLIHEIVPDAPWRVVGLMHVHHGVRDRGADQDAEFCSALASRLGWPFDVARVDVPSRMREARVSLEVAARDLRYEALAAGAGRLGADWVATGHTQDDQAETVLMRLLRGTSARGLSGIRRRRGRWIRPLLDVRRAELRAYLESRGETFREDPSNADVAIARNRVRHELLPVIERIAPGGVAALARTADLAARDEAFLQAALIREADSAVSSTEGDADVRLDAGVLSALPEPLARRLVGSLLERVGGRRCRLVHLDAVRRFARGERLSGHLDLPGVSLERMGDELRLSPTSSTGPTGPATVPPFEATLEVPGSVDWPRAGVRVVARQASGESPEPGPDRAIVQEASVALPLRVRNRRPGDRLRPLGAPGRRKLQDVLVDRKVPRADRDSVPIVVDAEGRVVWVAGVAVAHDCRVTNPQAGVVVLELRR